MLYLCKYCHIYVYVSTYTYTNKIEANRKNPNLIIYPRMSFLVIFTYYTLCNPRPTYFSLHEPSFVMPLCWILCLDSLPSPPLAKLRKSNLENQLKVTPGKVSCSFLCSQCTLCINLSILYTALQICVSVSLCVSLRQSICFHFSHTLPNRNMEPPT